MALSFLIARPQRVISPAEASAFADDEGEWVGDDHLRPGARSGDEELDECVRAR